MTPYRILALVAFGAALAAPPAAGQSAALKGRWLTDGMVVDGSPADWPPLVAIAAGVTAAAAHDDRTLRLIVATNDPALRGRLAVAGLMVYVDPKNRKAQNFAIRVPPMGGKPMPGERVVPHLTYVGVFGPVKGEMHLVDPPGTFGIDAAVGVRDDTWHIELAMPLRAGEGRPYAPGIAANARVIGLGLVTPDPPKPPSGGNRGGGAGGGGWSFGGYGGGYGGGMSPPPPGTADRDNALGKPVKVWTKIELAQR